MKQTDLAKKQKALEKRHRKRLVNQLGREMSRISKECYYAEWLRNSEYIIPELCRQALHHQEVQIWGCGEISPERAAKLAALAAELGHWVRYDFKKAKFRPFNPFPLPEHTLGSIQQSSALLQTAELDWSFLMATEGASNRS